MDAMRTAQAVFRDKHQILVACPYCFEVHTHGDGGVLDVSGNCYSSHCGKGEYRVLGMYDFRAGYMMLSRREADVARKRASRAAEKASKAPKEPKEK